MELFFPQKPVSAPNRAVFVASIGCYRYLDQRSSLDAKAKRVWLLYGRGATAYVSVPPDWHALVPTLGSTQLRLNLVERATQ